MTHALTKILEDHAQALAEKKPLDHLDYVLIDGSGSMMDKWWNFITAADILLDDIRASGLDTHLIVHVFDTADIAMIQRDGPLASEPKLTDPARPLGSHFNSTPFYDAISVMGRRLQALAPQAASILIVTDGHDTSSATTVIQARAVLDWMRANGWQVTFLGCDFNNSSQAKELGIDEHNAIGVSKEHLDEAARNFAGKRIRYGQTGQSIHFTDAEKQQFGGYLTGKKDN